MPVCTPHKQVAQERPDSPTPLEFKLMDQFANRRRVNSRASARHIERLEGGTAFAFLNLGGLGRSSTSLANGSPNSIDLCFAWAAKKESVVRRMNPVSAPQTGRREDQIETRLDKGGEHVIGSLLRKGNLYGSSPAAGEEPIRPTLEFIRIDDHEPDLFAFPGIGGGNIPI